MSAVGLATICAAGGGYMDRTLALAHALFIDHKQANAITFSDYIPTFDSANE
jgi:hypothetical protein